MSQSATPSQSCRVYLFGQSSQREVPQGADPTPLGQRLIDFLTGAYKGPLSERESELLHQEFIAMEAFRLRMQSAIIKCAGELQQEAAANIRENDGAYRLSESYDAGLRLGKYVGFCDAAQRVQNAINTTTIQTHVDNDKLTAERVARLEEKQEPEGSDEE